MIEIKNYKQLSDSGVLKATFNSKLHNMAFSLTNNEGVDGSSPSRLIFLRQKRESASALAVGVCQMLI